jgi:single-stranded-DNA-specific exonuclease
MGLQSEEASLDRHWTCRPIAPEAHFARLATLDLPRPVAQVLYNRKLTHPAQVASFLARDAQNSNPFEMRGMLEAVARIRHAIEHGERIVVHGDFDADGVTSTAVMFSGLYALGARVYPYIPHRVDEGYGLNADRIRRMKDGGITLIVTVDCGIRAESEIRLANSLGIDVVVTDHHSPPDELPPAHAIVNPHQEGCPYEHKMLAGVGLAWKTVEALHLAERKSPVGKSRERVDLQEMLALVALGTVADVAPLTGENRKLVWKGLEQLRSTKRAGLEALMACARVEPATVNAESIGFYLGPRLNAAGRMDNAMLAYHLLRAPDEEKARDLASQLEQHNRHRQALTSAALERARDQITDPSAPLLLVADDNCPEGIVGLVAGRLAEKYYRPAIVVSQGPELSRASCRSIPEFHITHALDRVSHLLERHGGHAAAAGFTVRSENLPILEKELLDLADEALPAPYRNEALRPRIVAEAELPLEQIDDSLADALETLAPFGAENEEPRWMARRVRVRDKRMLGNGSKHLQLTLQGEGGGQPWRAVAWRQGERYHEVQVDDLLDIAFCIKRNTWNGNQRLELHLDDFRQASGL